jgi:hypothetical protein
VNVLVQNDYDDNNDSDSDDGYEDDDDDDGVDIDDSRFTIRTLHTIYYFFHTSIVITNTIFLQICSNYRLLASGVNLR